jgi:hypothetical protein
MIRIVHPQGMGELILGFLIVEGADRARIEVSSELRHRVIGAFAQPQSGPGSS